MTLEMVLVYFRLQARPPTPERYGTAGQHPLRLGAAGLPPRPLRPAHAAGPETDQGRAVQPLDGVHRGHPPRTAHGPPPRMAALAETGWANDRKGLQRFRARRIPALVAARAEGQLRPPICSRASNDAPAALPKPNTPAVL